MAMRQRGGGTVRPPSRSAGVQPVFEDFKPISEWEQDDESHYLVIYLPVLKKNVDKGTSPKKPQETFSPKTTSTDTTLQKGQDKVLPQNSSPRGTSELKEEKNTRQQKMLDDQRDKNSTTPMSDVNLVLQDLELKEDHAASNRQQAIVPTITVDKERKNLEKREELPQVENAEKKKFDKDEAVGASKDRESKGKQTIHASEGDYSAFKMGNYKKKVKALTELNEERQLLVNMGVAVLVIVALSAYVTYKFASGKANS